MKKRWGFFVKMQEKGGEYAICALHRRFGVSAPFSDGLRDKDHHRPKSVCRASDAPKCRWAYYFAAYEPQRLSRQSPVWQSQLGRISIRSSSHSAPRLLKRQLVTPQPMLCFPHLELIMLSYASFSVWDDIAPSSTYRIRRLPCFYACRACTCGYGQSSSVLPSKKSVLVP